MSRTTIHLVNPFASAFGGSERRALDYHALLSADADVILWAERDPDVTLAGYPFRRLDPAGGTLPPSQVPAADHGPLSAERIHMGASFSCVCAVRSG